MMTSAEIRRHTNSVEDEAVDEDDIDIDVTGRTSSSSCFVFLTLFRSCNVLHKHSSHVSLIPV